MDGVYKNSVRKKNCGRHGLPQNRVRLCTLGFDSSRTFRVIHRFIAVLYAYLRNKTKNPSAVADGLCICVNLDYLTFFSFLFKDLQKQRPRMSCNKPSPADTKNIYCCPSIVLRKNARMLPS